MCYYEKYFPIGFYIMQFLDSFNYHFLLISNKINYYIIFIQLIYINYQFSPAAGSPTTTLLRLGPSYQPQINKITFSIL